MVTETAEETRRAQVTTVFDVRTVLDTMVARERCFQLQGTILHSPRTTVKVRVYFPLSNYI